jgi:hypothetical protein
MSGRIAEIVVKVRHIVRKDNMHSTKAMTPVQENSRRHTPCQKTAEITNVKICVTRRVKVFFSIIMLLDFEHASSTEYCFRHILV